MLNVDYVASGSVCRSSNRLAVMVELTETRTPRIVWSETFDHRIDDALSRTLFPGFPADLEGHLLGLSAKQAYSPAADDCW